MAGLVMGAALEAAVGHGVLGQTSPWLGNVLLSLAAVVLHPCAPGSSAVGAVLIHKGLGAGATVGALTAAMGVHAVVMSSHRRPTARLALAVLVCTVIGATADHWLPSWVVPNFHAVASPTHTALEWVASVLLAIWLTAGLLWLGPRAWLSRLWQHKP